MMTIEQVANMLRFASKDMVNPRYRTKFKEAADTIDAHLREGEKSRAALERFVADSDEIELGSGDCVVTSCESLELARESLSPNPAARSEK